MLLPKQYGIIANIKPMVRLWSKIVQNINTMNDELMPVAKALLQVIKRFLCGTYCGFRQCVYLLLLAIVFTDCIFPETGVMILFSLLYAVFYYWVTAFIKQSSMLKKCVISYIFYMLTMLVFVYFGDNVREFNIHLSLKRVGYTIFTQILLISFAPIFSIALTTVELFAKKSLLARRRLPSFRICWKAR